MFFFDPLYLLFIGPALVLSLWAQAKVRGTYARFSRVPNMIGLSGAEAARRLLDANGLQNVRVEGVPGELSDHYDPRTKVLKLSAGVFRNASVASLGIVAHEVGHAVQDRTAYGPLRLRSGLVPLASVGSKIGVVLLIIGVVIQFSGMVWLGIALFSMGTIFALVTLPVELNASRRAVNMLQANGMVNVAEVAGTRKVLSAAAWTYVAGLLAAIAQLLYWVTLASGMRRRD